MGGQVLLIKAALAPSTGQHGFGLCDLSYLQRECAKQNVHVEISMSRVPRTDLTLINLTLQL